MSDKATGTGQSAVPVAVPVRWSVRFFIVWLVLLAIWEVLVRTGFQTGLFLPAPSRIGAALGLMLADGTLAIHLPVTIIRIIGGLIGGALVGLLLGLAMGMSTRLRRLMDPIVAALHPIPRLAFFPLLIVIFGVGESSKLAAVSLGAFFPMLLNTVAGVRGMNPVHLELARSYGATRKQMFLKVLLPGSLPLMLTGLRLSSNVAFHATIGVEMVGSRTGIGSLLWLSWQTFRIDHLYATLTVIAVIGIGQASLIRWVTVRGAPWLAERPVTA
jgi:ABC-type nitrate/sulfonate/bicarbonate transport system permease component